MTKQWKSAGATEELWFSPFGSEMKVATLRIDEEGCYWGNGNLIGEIYVGETTFNEAKKYIESIILQYYASQIKYYRNLKESFEKDVEIFCQSDELCALSPLKVRDKKTGEVHIVGENKDDSLFIFEGVVAYTNLSTGEGTLCGPNSRYEFVDSDDSDTLCIA